MPKSLNISKLIFAFTRIFTYICTIFIYIDTTAIMQVIGCVYNNPQILDFTDRYSIVDEDFPDQFHKIIFGAIYAILAICLFLFANIFKCFCIHIILYSLFFINLLLF